MKGPQNNIYKLKQDYSLENLGLHFKAGQEFNIINDVVYMEGYPLPMGLQVPVLRWIRNNTDTLFAIYNRDY